MPWAAGHGQWPDGADTGGFEHSGLGTGRVPAVWGPDAEDPIDDEDGTGSWDTTPPGRSWLRLAAVVAGAIALVVAVLFAFNLGRDAGDEGATGQGTGDGSPSASESAQAPVQIAAVSDFDPEADPAEENPDLAPLAADGKPGTAWETLTYRGNPELGGLKSGVGLLVDLGEPTDVGDVRLTLMGTPTSLEVLAAPDATTAPSSTDGLDTVASAEDLGTRAELSLRKPVTTRWLVVWLTSLPPAPGGFQGRVAEISVSS